MAADIELSDAFRRLVDMLEFPERIPVFVPMIMREIHFLSCPAVWGATSAFQHILDAGIPDTPGDFLAPHQL